MIAITGNTYPVRDRLRQLGGRWDPDRRAWMVPSDRAEEARSIVTRAVPSDHQERRSRRWPRVCRPLQAGEEIIDRPSRGPDDPGYKVGQTHRFGRVWGGGGPDGYYWTVIETWKERYDDTEHHWAIMRAATPEEAATAAA
jgi:hypothetical protein